MIKKLMDNKLFAQIIRFGAVGFFCFFIEYGLLIVLRELMHMPVLVANLLAFTISAVVNYLFSIFFIFETDKEKSRLREFIVFFVLAVGGLIINELVLLAGTKILDPLWNRSYLIVKPFATGVVMIYNFITRKLFIEKKTESEKA